MKPNRKPDFIYLTTRRKNGTTQNMYNFIFWKEQKLIIEIENELLEYGIYVHDYGRIDMYTDNWCMAIGSIPGVKDSYEEFMIEETLLGDT